MGGPTDNLRIDANLGTMDNKYDSYAPSQDHGDVTIDRYRPAG